jgi:hypothetical protein
MNFRVNEGTWWLTAFTHHGSFVMREVGWSSFAFILKLRTTGGGGDLTWNATSFTCMDP